MIFNAILGVGRQMEPKYKYGYHIEALVIYPFLLLMGIELSLNWGH